MRARRRRRSSCWGVLFFASCSSNLVVVVFMSHCTYKYTRHTHTHTHTHGGISLSLFGGMCCDPCRRSDAATHPEVAIRMRPRHESAKAIFLMKSMQQALPPSFLTPSPPALPRLLLVSSAYAQINLIANKLPGASKRKQKEEEGKERRGAWLSPGWVQCALIGYGCCC